MTFDASKHPRKGASSATGNAGHFATVVLDEADLDLDTSWLDAGEDVGFFGDEPAPSCAPPSLLADLAGDTSDWLRENSADIGWDDGAEQSVRTRAQRAGIPAALNAEAEERVRAVGEMVSARAVDLSGVDVEVEKMAYDLRSAAANERMLTAGAAVMALNTATETRDVHAIDAYVHYCAMPGGYTDRLRERVAAFDPELPAKIDAAVAARKAANAHLKLVLESRDPETKAALTSLADGYRQALSEVRDLGGQLDYFPKSTKPGKAAFDEAQGVYPADWVAWSNDDENKPMALISKKRAHYQHTKMVHTKERVRTAHEVRMTPEIYEQRKDFVSYSYTEIGGPDANGAKLYRSESWRYTYPNQNPAVPPKGRGWEFHEATGRWRQPSYRMKTVDTSVTPEILTNKVEPRIEGRSDTFSTAVHESAHRYEATVPQLKSLERAFLDRRCRDELGNLNPRITIGPGEYARRGGFAIEYVGKEYSEGSREVLSCGAEALFGGRHGGLVGLGKFDADTDHRDFVLGLMATAGRRS